MSNTRRADRFAKTIVTFGGLGRLPIAPGTWATLGAACVHALAVWLVGTSASAYILPALVILATVTSGMYQPWAEQHYGKPDPGPFVIDEVAGYLLTVSFFPHEPQWFVGGSAFVFFRLFDVLKPFPIRRVERIRRWGIVADDLLAGMYAALCTQLVLLAFFP